MGAVPAAARAAWQQVRCCARIFACDRITNASQNRGAPFGPRGGNHLHPSTCVRCLKSAFGNLARVKAARRQATMMAMA